MKKGKTGRKFGRDKDQRKALLRSLMVSLIDKEAITTTEAKARELRPTVEKMISKARKGGLAKTRDLEGDLPNKKAVSKLVKTLGPKYKDRAGGYTRITKLPLRKNGAVKMAKIEFI